jgi:NADPH:quinone reductase-like Zn-dependent oxidoreductase
MNDYQAFRILQDAAGHHAGVERLPLPVPAAGEVLIRVSWSAVNYKDALAATGRGKTLTLGRRSSSRPVRPPPYTDPAVPQPDAVIGPGRDDRVVTTSRDQYAAIQAPLTGPKPL